MAWEGGRFWRTLKCARQFAGLINSVIGNWIWMQARAWWFWKINKNESLQCKLNTRFTAYVDSKKLLVNLQRWRGICWSLAPDYELGTVKLHWTSEFTFIGWFPVANMQCFQAALLSNVRENNLCMKFLHPLLLNCWKTTKVTTQHEYGNALCNALWQPAHQIKRN